MSSPAELEAKFWKALGSDRTVMLGLIGVDDGQTRPMTAQFEDDKGPIWFFASTENELVNALSDGSRAIATFSAKGNELYAAIHGTLVRDNDRAVIDRLWNPFVAAWYERGKNDPKLVLLRLDTERAQIWLNGSSILAGIKMLLGRDPKQDFKENVAEVELINQR